MGFFKDLSGIVHFQGMVACRDSSTNEFGTVFTLPVGYRPANTELIGAVDCQRRAAWVYIFPRGVRPEPPGYSCIVLEGISFRAG